MIVYMNLFFFILTLHFRVYMSWGLFLVDEARKEATSQARNEALGLIAVVLGVWLLSDPTFIVSGSQELQNYQAGVYIVIATGALLVIVSFLAICGAFRESQSLLVISSSCLLVIIVILSSAGAWLYTNRDGLDPLIKRIFSDTIRKEYGVIDLRTQTVDRFQLDLECCGANGPRDWAASAYGSKDPNQPIKFTVSSSTDFYYIPSSCCRRSSPAETLDELKESDTCNNARKLAVGDNIPPNIYDKGCTKELIDIFHRHGYIFFVVIIGLGLLELVGLLLSMIFCCSIGSPERYKA